MAVSVNLRAISSLVLRPTLLGFGQPALQFCGSRRSKRKLLGYVGGDRGIICLFIVISPGRSIASGDTMSFVGWLVWVEGMVSNEKGTKVIYRGHSSRIPRGDKGFFATLRAFLCVVKGVVRRDVGSLCRSAVVLAGLSLVVTAAPAVASTSAGSGSVLTAAVRSVAPAVAGNPPEIEVAPIFEEIYSTRARFLVRANTERLPVKWHSEYSTSDTWPGILAGSGETPKNENPPEEDMYLGTEDATEGHVLHHLLPEKTYYAHFVVEDEAGTAVATYEFTTLPVGKPEVPKRTHTDGEGIDPTTFSKEGLTPTSAGFAAQVESNGATTEYAFESSEQASGHWSSFATGTVTEAEDFADPAVKLTELKPEHTYYVRIRASNEKGVTEQAKFYGLVAVEQGGAQEEVSSFTTPTARPQPSEPILRNVTVNSAHINSSVVPNGFETVWRLEYATSESAVSWDTLAEGTVFSG